jgi:hypothetical protein
LSVRLLERRDAQADGRSTELSLGVVALGSQEGESHVDAFDLADPPVGLCAGAAVESLRLPPRYRDVV